MRVLGTPRRSTMAVLAGIWLATGAGCASLAVPSVTRFLERQRPVVAPNRVAVVWTTALLASEGSPSTRGFGGVVTFHGDQRKSPVRVDGELTVYAYDELSRGPGESAPDRKYVFTRDQLEKHYGKGPAGPAYHIWIPWDKVGGPRRDVSLIARFNPVEGSPVIGKPSRAVLPGPTDTLGRVVTSRRTFATCASPLPDGPGKPAPPNTASPDTSGRKMQTTTLTLPPRAMPLMVASRADGQPPRHEQPTETAAP